MKEATAATALREEDNDTSILIVMELSNISKETHEKNTDDCTDRWEEGTNLGEIFVVCRNATVH